MSSKIWKGKSTCCLLWHSMQRSKRSENQGEESSVFSSLALGITEDPWSDPERGVLPANPDSLLSWKEHRRWFGQHRLLSLEQITSNKVHLCRTGNPDCCAETQRAAQVSFITLIKGVKEPLPTVGHKDWLSCLSPQSWACFPSDRHLLSNSSQLSLTPLLEHPCEYSPWLAIPELGCLLLLAFLVEIADPWSAGNCYSTCVLPVCGWFMGSPWVFCVVFPFQVFLCIGCTVNAKSTAACECSEGVGERALYILMNTQLHLLLSSGSCSLCRVMFSVLRWESCDCQKVVLIGTSDLKIVL